MTKVCVLGIGNRLMKDDGIGIYVTEALQKQNKSENIEFIIGESDIDYSLSAIEKANILIIIDSVLTDGTAGKVNVFQLDKDWARFFSLGISAHNLHLFHMIPMLYPDMVAFVVGIEASCIEFGTQLSESLDRQFQSILRQVCCKIDEIIYVT